MENRIIINLGRQFGSGGRRVGAALGERLGIPVYDRQLITEAAQKSGYSPEVFRKKEERKRLFSFFSNNGVDDSEIFRIQSEIIRDIASRGSAIFLGRASDYVLRDMPCLNIFLTAPADVRAEHVAQMRGISPEEAAEACAKEDRERETYYNFFTFRNWGVAANYDLCLDTSRLGIEGSADFIIEFGRRTGYLK